MKTLTIGPIETAMSGNEVSVSLEMESSKYHLYYKTNDSAMAGRLEPLIIASLSLCMKKGLNISAEGAASRQLLAGLEKLQGLYHSWRPDFKHVEFEKITPEVNTDPSGKRVGVFFSGGLDSFYTFLEHKDEITDLIFFHGFDIPLQNHSLRKQASEMNHRVADSFNKRLVEIETNVFNFFDQYINRRWTYGAVIAGAGYLLDPPFKRIYFAAPCTYDYEVRSSAHPDVFPLYSSETLEFIYHGGNATRVQKAKLLAQYDIALQTLRVCTQNRGGAYNCGRCEKCIRTMINLELAGALDRCTTFDEPIDPRRILYAYAADDSVHEDFLQENLGALEGSNADQQLAKALRRAARIPRWVKKSISAAQRVRRRMAKHRE